MDNNTLDSKAVAVVMEKQREKIAALESALEEAQADHCSEALRANNAETRAEKAESALQKARAAILRARAAVFRLESWMAPRGMLGQRIDRDRVVAIMDKLGGATAPGSAGEEE